MPSSGSKPDQFGAWGPLLPDTTTLTSKTFLSVYKVHSAGTSFWEVTKNSAAIMGSRISFLFHVPFWSLGESTGGRGCVRASPVEVSREAWLQVDVKKITPCELSKITHPNKHCSSRWVRGLENIQGSVKLQSTCNCFLNGLTLNSSSPTPAIPHTVARVTCPHYPAEGTDQLRSCKDQSNSPWGYETGHVFLSPGHVDSGVIVDSWPELDRFLSLSSPLFSLSS